MRHWTRLAVLALLPAFVACGDVSLGDVPGSASASVDDTPSKVEQGLVVQTRFELAGAESVQERLELERLSLNIGAVILEPLDERAGQASFVNPLPFNLDFGVLDGDTSLLGPELVLPYGGRFAVSVLLEPASSTGDYGDKREDDADSSVVAAGLWTPGSDAVAEPSPLPWMPKADEERVPFVYRSDAVVRVALAEVTLDEDGVYELVMTLSIGDWLEGDVIPALEDQLHRRRARPDFSRLPVDGEEVEEPLDTASTDIEGLASGMDVAANRF